MGTPDGNREWLKIEFAKEGLVFERSGRPPQIRSSFLTEKCVLHDISPTVLADCLQGSKHRTYNAISWNCNHVADMIWDEILKSNSCLGDQGTGRWSSGIDCRSLQDMLREAQDYSVCTMWTL